MRSFFVLAAVLSAVLSATPAAATCFDGVRNGRESSIDCGGDCPPCEHGRYCRIPRDCASGRCAAGICEVRIYRRGDPVPAGYHVEVSGSDGAATSRTFGWVSFGVGYGAAYVSALSLPGELSWLYMPVIGPWVEVADSKQNLRGLIALDGLLQTVGAGLLIGGIVTSGKELLRNDAIGLVHVSPFVGRDVCGVGMLGAF